MSENGGSHRSAGKVETVKILSKRGKFSKLALTSATSG